MNARFKRVFDGMVNNSPQGIYEQAGTWSAFDFAYRIYREPKYIPTLKAAKLWPPSYLSAAEIRAAESKIGERLTESSVLPNVGYLWLREQSPRGFRALSINYISQWDRLEHDRLHFSLFDEHGRLASEIGRIIYSAPEAVTMQSTFAHNTVVVDGKNQEFQPSTLAAFLDSSSLPAALITENPHSPLYSGIEFSRVVAILDGVFFIGDLYNGKGEHTFDWPFYAPWQPGDKNEIAVPRTTLKLQDVKSTGFDSAQPNKSTFSEYPWISKAQSAKTDESISVALRVEEAESQNPRDLQITFAPMQNALFVDAQIPRGYRPKPGPMFFVRREKCSTAQFGAAFDITTLDEKSCIQKVENISITEKTAAWRVQTVNGKYLIIINRGGGAVRADGFETKEMLYVARMQ